MAKKVETIVLPDLKRKRAKIQLKGLTPLLMHRFSEKARREMLDKQLGKAKASKRAAKVPEKDYQESMYVRPDGHYGFPALAFKSAVVTAANDAGIQKVLARRAFHVIGPELARIDGEPSMREDVVRVGMGTADLRYRAEFKQWETEIEIIYNEGVISLEQLVNLFRIAGFGVGVGDWRPERNGMHGTWEVIGVEVGDVNHPE